MPVKQTSPLLTSPCLYKVIYNQKASKNDAEAPFTNWKKQNGFQMNIQGPEEENI